MGTGTFFSKVAAVDPLAHILNLPGANKYGQQQASSMAGSSTGGAYQGITPTLAGSNAGYAAGGPGAIAGYVPWTATQPGGIMGFGERFANAAGNLNPVGNAATSLLGGGTVGGAINNGTSNWGTSKNPSVANSYGAAGGGNGLAPNNGAWNTYTTGS